MSSVWADDGPTLSEADAVSPAPASPARGARGDPPHRARRAFPKGTLCLRIADALGPVDQDSQFAALFPRRGRPAGGAGRARAGGGSAVRRGSRPRSARRPRPCAAGLTGNTRSRAHPERSGILTTPCSASFRCENTRLARSPQLQPRSLICRRIRHQCHCWERALWLMLQSDKGLSSIRSGRGVWGKPADSAGALDMPCA